MLQGLGLIISLDWIFLSQRQLVNHNIFHVAEPCNAAYMCLMYMTDNPVKSSFNCEEYQQEIIINTILKIDYYAHLIN